MRQCRKPAMARRAARFAILLGLVAAGTLAAGGPLRNRRQTPIAVGTVERDEQDAMSAREAPVRAVSDAAQRDREEMERVENRIRQAEENLIRARLRLEDFEEWAGRIRSKGYLLYIRGLTSERLTYQKAVFALEVARSDKVRLEYLRSTRNRVPRPAPSRAVPVKAEPQKRVKKPGSAPRPAQASIASA